MASTPLSRAHRWLRSYLRDHYALERSSAHPVHTSMHSTVYFPLKTSNVWIDVHVDLYCYVGKPIQLAITAGRCGPETRSTEDGPIEIDFPIASHTWSYPEFDEEALQDVKRNVLNVLPTVLKAYHETADKYAAQKVPLL